MNAKWLLAYYERVADAPDAVARVRRFVLDLAVRGKLVPQDASDEPAQELLKRIENERARLVKLGEIKKEKPLPELTPSETPYEAPVGWRWVRIRKIASDRGQTIPTQDFTYIDVTAINKDAGRIEGAKITSAHDAPSRARKIVRGGDVLYSCVRPYLLNVAIIDGDISPPPIASTAFAVLNGFGLVLPKYQWIVLRSPFMIACVEEKMRGQAYPAINDSDFSLLPFPLPPLAEQHRIVGKFDELMALCDRLEAARTEREAARDRMASASLARLNTPDNATAGGDVRFALDALQAITARPDQIKGLRHTIRGLAVRGRLVPQSASDGSGLELLSRIASEIPDSKADDIILGKLPFEVPETWTWTCLGKLVSHSDAGWSPKTEEHARRDGAWGVLKVSAVSWDEFRASENKQLLPGTEPRLQAQVKHGDFLISRANTAELVARAVIVKEEPIKLMMSDKIVRLRLSANCEPRFVWLVNNYADFARDHYVRCATGVSPSMKNVSRDVIMKLPLPFPPLPEQRRIVAKVDALMALCDRLEESLNDISGSQRHLLDALLHDALKPLAAHSREAAE